MARRVSWLAYCCQYHAGLCVCVCWGVGGMRMCMLVCVCVCMEGAVCVHACGKCTRVYSLLSVLGSVCPYPLCTLNSNPLQVSHISDNYVKYSLLNVLGSVYRDCTATSVDIGGRLLQKSLGGWVMTVVRSEAGYDCTHTHTRTRTHTHVHTHTYTRTHSYTHTCAHTHTCTHTCAHTYIHTRAHTLTGTYTGTGTHTWTTS